MITFDSVGTTLPNGAVVVALSARNADEWVVLALRTDNTDEPYVTWKCRRAGDGSDTRLGHYFDDLDNAVADFHGRS